MKREQQRALQWPLAAAQGLGTAAQGLGMAAQGLGTAAQGLGTAAPLLEASAAASREAESALTRCC